MCTGGQLLADFCAGTYEQPDLPELVGNCLTSTVDGVWLVWAHKVARRASGDGFVPLTRGDPYPADAVARCRSGSGHDSPHPDCRCGFHALSADTAFPHVTSRWPGLLRLDVALSGRILAYEWDEGGVLFRAARQTVVRVHEEDPIGPRVPPDDPDGLLACRSVRQPRGAGPVQLRLPQASPAEVALVDDAGYCFLEVLPGVETAAGTLTTV